MSSIFDFEDKSTLSGDFPVPDNADFPDDEDMETGKVKHKVKGDFKVNSFRGTKNAGQTGRHVINIQATVLNNEDYDGTGEVGWWFDADSFEGQWGGIAAKQAAGLARLAVAMGLVDEAAYEGLSLIQAVEVTIDAANKYKAAMGYVFGGQLEFVKQKKDDGRVFMNHNLYINRTPRAELPF